MPRAARAHIGFGTDRMRLIDELRRCAERPHEMAHIYVVQQMDEGPVKIGHAGNLPRRFAALQSANPYPLTMRTYCYGPRILEEKLHLYFRDYRLHGEWFLLPAEDVHALVAVLQTLHDEIAQHRSNGVPDAPPMAWLSKTP